MTRVALLGTGFGRAHAAIYAARSDVDVMVVFGRTPEKLTKIGDEFGFAITTDIDTVYDDPEVELVDVCLPTGLHAEHTVRAVRAGKHVLCELPLASTMADAQLVVDAAAASDRQVFVDMSGRFDPASQFVHDSITAGTYGPIKTLHIATRTALLWEGYQIGLDSIAMDVMHGSLDILVTALGRPDSTIALGVDKHSRESAAEVLLTYPGTIVHYSASALMPKPYGLRGGWRAVFTDAVVESEWTAGYDGRPTGTLTEYTSDGAKDIPLPSVDTYTAVIDHVLACLAGHTSSRLDPASVLDSLQLTLDIHHQLTTGRATDGSLT